MGGSEAPSGVGGYWGAGGGVPWYHGGGPEFRDAELPVIFHGGGVARSPQEGEEAVGAFGDTDLGGRGCKLGGGEEKTPR